jgi:site-specific recombinase XerD
MGDPSRVRVTGPLQEYAPGFAGELARLGYKPNAAADQLRLMAHLSRWMDAERHEAAGLTPPVAEEFLAARRAAGYVMWLSPRALAPLLGYLRRLGAVPELAPGPATPAGALLDRYQRYLVSERGLASSTARDYSGLVRPFLAQREAAGGLRLEQLTAAEVTVFVLDRCPSMGRGSAKLMVTALRSLLGFLHVSGMIAGPLEQVVPAVARWRLAGLPKALEPGQVAALLASCSQHTAAGRRDFAMLTLLARLGLRAGEVAAMTLDDIGWRDGEITVRGKGSRSERLPLPADVGDAITCYLRDGRPEPFEGTRQVFLRARAPHRGLTSAGVTAAVCSAGQRSGVGQVLRHQRLLSTAIYAKADIGALRALARPWPGGAV